MSKEIYYRQSGGISVKAPLEAFHDAMLPLLGKYGVTEKLPADKLSTAYDHKGIDFDVLIGEPPNAVRYSIYQANSHESGFFEMKLEATLQNAAAGDSLFLKIEITNAAPKPTKGIWLNVEFKGEKSQVEAMKNSIAPVLAKYDFESQETEINESPFADDPPPSEIHSVKDLPKLPPVSVLKAFRSVSDVERAQFGVFMAMGLLTFGIVSSVWAYWCLTGQEYRG